MGCLAIFFIFSFFFALFFCYPPLLYVFICTYNMKNNIHFHTVRISIIRCFHPDPHLLDHPNTNILSIYATDVLVQNPFFNELLPFFRYKIVFLRDRNIKLIYWGVSFNFFFLFCEFNFKLFMRITPVNISNCYRLLCLTNI